MKTAAPTVAGVDVGGAKKGFHAVVLHRRRIVAKLRTHSAATVADWCRKQRVSAIGIDAPCRWSLTGRARPCERELAGLGLSCFSTPSQTLGEVHPFYRWMVHGAELFQLLAPHYQLFDGQTPPFGPLCFETFPQAIACSLTDNTLSAKRKRVERREILEERALSTKSLTCIDEIDAALCALAAQHVLSGTFKAFGDSTEGFILLPSCSYNLSRSLTNPAQTT